MTIQIDRGLYLRRGALPRPPDRMQVVDDLPEFTPTLREQVLAQFPPKARSLAR